MRVIKREKIIITQDERVIWEDFEKFLEEIERESEDSENITLINKIQSCLSELWEEVEKIE